ncbi:uncharacterized protein [Rutidosis leptorrhynchoides]|uniref:uncharacterized protein n=1 Tax=Rutidosis leptorrhynchoides TaxID=125765 RepID=UPI003A9900A5
MAGIVILSKEKLEMLSEYIYRQEALAIHNIQFDSENARVLYLYACKSNRETVLTLANSTADLVCDDKSKVASDIAEYINVSCNLALQTVREHFLRSDYLEKIKSCSDSLMSEFRDLQAGNDPSCKSKLMEKVTNIKNVALELAKQYQNPAASIPFTKKIEGGWSRGKLFPNKSYDLFKDPEKLEVFQDIIEASGFGGMLASKIAKPMCEQGIAAILIGASMVVWEIVTGFGAFVAGPFAGSGANNRTTNGFIPAEAAMPDGLAIARQIAHEA